MRDFSAVTRTQLDRRRTRRAIVAAVCAVGGSAHAETDETAVAEPTVPDRPQFEHAGCGSKGGGKVKTGARTTVGALVGGPSRGGYGRLDLEVFQGSIRRPEVLIGVAPIGVGAWGGAHGGGGGFGTWAFLGYASPTLFATAGAGVDWVIYDRVDGAGGVGLAAPLGVLNVGLSSRSMRIYLDARAQRRWHFGLGAETQRGLGVGATFVL